MIVDADGFARRIRMARLYKGWSLTDLAQHAGILPSTCRNYEDGRSFPKFDILIRVSSALGVSMNWLAYGNTPPRADRELMTRLVQREQKEMRRMGGYRDA